MQLKLLRGKLHLATVTGAALDYHGSLSVDPLLLEAAGLLPYEAVTVSNTSTGQRAETYLLPGPVGSGQVELNGAMARLGSVGDRLIVMAFAYLEPREVPAHRARVLVLDRRNQIVDRIEYDASRPVGGRVE